MGVKLCICALWNCYPVPDRPTVLRRPAGRRRCPGGAGTRLDLAPGRGLHRPTPGRLPLWIWAGLRYPAGAVVPWRGAVDLAPGRGRYLSGSANAVEVSSWHQAPGRALWIWRGAAQSRRLWWVYTLAVAPTSANAVAGAGGVVVFSWGGGSGTRAAPTSANAGAVTPLDLGGIWYQGGGWLALWIWAPGRRRPCWLPLWLVNRFCNQTGGGYPAGTRAGALDLGRGAHIGQRGCGALVGLRYPAGAGSGTRAAPQPGGGLVVTSLAG